MEREATLLVEAAASGSLQTLQELLATPHADINAQDENGDTALHAACATSQMAVVRWLLDAGARLDMKNKGDQTPLFRAAVKGHRSVVEFLLDAGADISAAEEDGWLPLHGAAQSGDMETIKLLVERGADLHSLTKDGRLALYLAAMTGFKEAVDFFISHGLNLEDINKVDGYGFAAIHRAARNGDVKGIELLFGIGVDLHTVDTFGWSILHFAAQGGSVEVIELLLRAGADINAKDESGESVLHTALWNGENVAAKFLMRAGAHTAAIVESTGWSIFLCAAFGGSVELLKLFVDSGENVNAVANDGKNALHLASSSGKREAVEYLVGLGLDLNAADEDGYRPLHLATKEHFHQATEALLVAGADVHALTNNGESSLQLAVFAEPGLPAKALPTVIALCSFGAEWTTQCQAKLMEMKADVETSDADAADERHQQLQWYLGLRTCILYWEIQHRDGAKDLTKVPIEVVQRGAASVKTYLVDASSSNADDLVYRCKVCVVGPSEWGKSSLVRSIETMRPFLVAARDRTIGIELVPMILTDARKQTTQDSVKATETLEASGPAVESDSPTLESSTPQSATGRHHEVTFWDFAGQDVYQVAHSLFFSRRTLYVLVVDVNAYLKQLELIESLRSAAAEASMDRFLGRYIFRWVRTIFARQTDAEFLVLGTKADLLEDEEEQAAKVWRDLQSRIYQWKLSYMRELEKEYGIVTTASSAFTGRSATVDQARQGTARIRELTDKLARLATDDWLVVSVTRPDSIEAVRQALRRTIEASERGFPMWSKYSRVLKAIDAKRAAANRPGDGLYRIEHGMIQFRPLCQQLMDEVDGLQYDECREILRTLHDLGDVIWYEHEESGELRDFIILDAMLVIDIVREVISHEHATKTGVSTVEKNQAAVEEKPRIDGRVTHGMLETFPLWKHMDKEMVYAFKMLLQQFQLAYPADDEVMQPDSDLIVPSYWKVQLANASVGTESATQTTTSVSVRATDDVSLRTHYCWEYEVSADLAESIFEQFAVQSFTNFVKRNVRANCIESSCAAFQSSITLHPGEAKHDVIRVEVTSANAEIAWLNMRYYVMKLEKVLDPYVGLAVPRYIVVHGKRHSLAPAAKAVRDSIMMGRDIESVRALMPWMPPDLDWFLNRAWLDIATFQELQMMHLVRDKLDVLQKLVVASDSQRRYPAVWSLAYDSQKRVAVLRMLSDLSGRCYHVPIQITVPPVFLAKYGSTIKEGVSLLANVTSSSLSVPILQTALDGAVSCLETKTQQATAIHNLIERMDLSTTSGNATKTSKDSGLSPGGTMAVLRDVLKLHNDSLDELSITELCNLECAATSKGEYVWAHAHEISLLKHELTPCQPRYTDEASSSTSSEPHTEPESSRGGSRSSSKLRLCLCIETVTGLTSWDWYKTYCTWQLVYGKRKTPVCSGATTTNADSTMQPSWRSLLVTLDAVESMEMLQECRLVVQVKRRSRIGWTKFIGEGQVELRTVDETDGKAAFWWDHPIEVILPTSGPSATQQVVCCQLSACS